MADKKKSSKKKSIVAQAEAKAEQITRSKAKDKAKGVKRPNPVVKYLRDLRSEFKKVVWPSKQKVINNTTVVVIAMTVCGIAIWGIDSGLAALLKLGLKG